MFGDLQFLLTITSDVVIDCGRAQTIPYGQVGYPSGKTHLDSVVQYSCAPNYKLNGPGERICTPNGIWSGSTPKCEGIDRITEM
jgi:hypothetical protein